MSLSLFNAVPAGVIETVSDSDNNPLFKRADLGRFLGIANVAGNYPKIATKSRSQLTREGFSLTEPLGRSKNSHDAFVDLDGALEIVARCKKPKALELFEKLGFNSYEHKYVQKETQTISYITKAFKGEQMIDQYCVDGYRIDLYFPAYKLAIECDEFNHRDRDIGYEVKRQKHIENKLKCQFIRFNPDAKDFCIFKVINEIFKEISS